MKYMNTAKAQFIDYSRLFHFMYSKPGKFESVNLNWLLWVYLVNVRADVKCCSPLFYLRPDFLGTTAWFVQKFTFNYYNNTFLLQRILPCKVRWRLILVHSFSSGASKNILDKTAFLCVFLFLISLHFCHCLSWLGLEAELQKCHQKGCATGE